MHDKPANNRPKNLEKRVEAMAVQKVCGATKFKMNCPICLSESKTKNTAIDQLGHRVRDHICKADASHQWRTKDGKITEDKFSRGFSVKRDGLRKERLQNIFELSKRSCGVSKSEIDYPASLITRCFNDLLAEGKIHRMCGSGALQGKNARYFANKEDGNRFFSKTKTTSDTLKIKYFKGPAFLEGEPDFSKAKITIAKAPDMPLRTNTHSPW